MKQRNGQSLQAWKVTSSGRMEAMSGGGCITLFGLPFLAAGIFVTLTALGVVKPQNANQIKGWAHLLFFLMGLVFTAVGAGLSFGRKWTIIDKVRGEILESWGLFVPMKSRRHTLAPYASVSLRLQRGDSDSPDTYPVEMVPGDGGKTLVLESPSDYAAAFARAEAVADFLGFPLVDRSGGREAVYHPEDRRSSFKERSEAEGAGPYRATRPPEIRSRVEREGRAVRIVIPGPGFRVTMVLSLAVPLLIAAWISGGLLEFFEKTKTPDFVQLFFFGFMALFLGLIPLLRFFKNLVRAARNHTLVTADRNGIAISETDAWKTKTTEISVKDILSLDAPEPEKAFAPQALARDADGRPRPFTGEPPGWLKSLAKLVRSKGVVVRSRKGLFAFGEGLPAAELAYLRSLVVAALKE
ncbi:MAG: hypothetical protein AB1921_17165 [Thermodesulfobacteriota bacterium]